MEKNDEEAIDKSMNLIKQEIISRISDKDSKNIKFFGKFRKVL